MVVPAVCVHWPPREQADYLRWLPRDGQHHQYGGASPPPGLRLNPFLRFMFRRRGNWRRDLGGCWFLRCTLLNRGRLATTAVYRFGTGSVSHCAFR